MFEPRGLVGALAAAIVDHDPVNWRDVVSAAGSAHERAVLDQLQTIARLERRAQPTVSVPSPGTLRRSVPILWSAITILAFAQVAIGACALLLSPRLNAGSPAWAPLAISVSFAAAALILTWSGREDRASNLGALYALTGAAFAQALLTAAVSSASWSLVVWSHRLYPEAFLPLAIWRFAIEFPRTERFTAFDRWSRAAVTASLWIGAGLFVNGWITSGWQAAPSAAPWEWLWRFRRVGMGAGFWIPTFALLLAALATMLLRTYASVGDERRRSIWFLGALAFGILPLFAAGMARNAWPHLDDFLKANPFSRGVVDAVVLTAILSMPFTTAYAVLVHRVLAVRIVVHRAVRHLLARYALLALVLVAIAVPFGQVYRHRDRRIDDVLHDASARVAGLVVVAGMLLLATRERLLTVIDRLFVGPVVDHAMAIRAATDAIGRGRTAREVASAAVGQLEVALDVSVVMLLRGAADEVQVLHGVAPPPAADTALWLLVEQVAAVDVGPDTALLEVLPAADRQWLTRCGFAVLARVPFPGRDVAGIAGLSARLHERPVADSDLSLVAAVLATAGVALHRHCSETTANDGEMDDPLGALECSRCGALWTPAPCACGASSRPALLPRLLAGKFEVIRRLGEGGMGVVYLGKDLRLGRPVALKTLPQLSGGETSAMFAEAKAMARVEHPNLALVYGLEIWRHTPVLLVEYLAGGTLRDRLASGPLAAGEALALGSTIAGALGALHHAGMLHRDIKPANLGFTRAGTPKLLDFGVAHLTEYGDASGGAGTPLYASPESINGAPATVYVDLWSTAVTALEAMVGTYPFGGRSVSDVIRRVGRGEPDWHRWRERLPAAANQFFDRALHRNVEQRFHSAAELAAACRDVIAEIETTVST